MRCQSTAIFFTAILVPIALCSCRTVSVDTLVPEDSLPNISCLPPMTITIDGSVEKAFPKESNYAGCGASTKTTFNPVFALKSDGGVKLAGVVPGEEYVPPTEGGTVWHPQMHDLASETFMRCVRSMFRPDLPKSSATIRCKVNGFKFSDVGAWPWAALLTLGTVNMLGFPFMEYEGVVEVELEIVNARKQSLAKYTARGTGTAFAACYWGYSHVGDPSESDYPGLKGKKRHIPAVRAALVLALADALNNIANQIKADSSTLVPRLS